MEQLNTIKPWAEKGYVEFPLFLEDKEERYGAGTAGGSGEVEWDKTIIVWRKRKSENKTIFTFKKNLEMM